MGLVRQINTYRQEGRPLRSQDAEIEFRVEEGDLQTVTCGGVPVRLGDAVDEAFETQPAQIVGHLSRRVRAPEEGFDWLSEIAVVETAGQMGEAGDRLTEGHHPWIGEAQRGGSLSGLDRGLLEPSLPFNFQRA